MPRDIDNRIFTRDSKMVSFELVAVKGDIIWGFSAKNEKPIAVYIYKVVAYNAENVVCKSNCYFLYSEWEHCK